MVFVQLENGSHVNLAQLCSITPPREGGPVIHRGGDGPASAGKGMIVFSTQAKQEITAKDYAKIMEALVAHQT